MKKTISVCLACLLIFSAFFLLSCAGGGTAAANTSLPNLPRVVVTKEPDNANMLLLPDNDTKTRYKTIQEALDGLLAQYNQSHDNKVLTQLCNLISAVKRNINDSQSVTIAYDTRLIDATLAKSGSIDAENVFEMNELSEDVCAALNALGRQDDCMRYIDGYAAHLQDENDRIYFCSIAYMQNFLNAPNVDKKYVNQINERAKQFQLDYDRVNITGKIGIAALLVKCAEINGDQKTADDVRAKVMIDVNNGIAEGSLFFDYLAPIFGSLTYGEEMFGDTAIVTAAQWAESIAK